jgi:hypothetical protein
MKKCSLCKEEKSLDNFRQRFRYNKYSPYSQCKACESKVQVKRHQERFKADKDFREKSLKRLSDWGKENKARRLKADADRRREKYQKDLSYRASAMSTAASYRSQKLKAEPPWLSQQDKLRTKNIYETAAKISRVTGKPHDVDHVVPLQGENICGLHVWWNLAIIPASMNRSKSNAYPTFNTSP